MKQLKTELKLIECTPMHERYLNAFIKTVNSKRRQLLDKDKAVIAQLVLYGVKYVAAYYEYRYKNWERENVEAYLLFIDEVRSIMGLLTFHQFVNLFPIEKVYDGDKYMIKDYYYTVEKLKEYDMNAPIGDNLDDVLWDYTNVLISRFAASQFSAINKLNRLNGGRDFLEIWAEENNMSTYTVNESEGYIIYNQTHEVTPYKKPKPDYLQLV